MTRPLALFYEEPDPDRWLPLDRFPRRVIRRIVRGAPRPGGHMRVFLNLCAGLDRLGVPYTVNDFRAARRDRSMPVGIVGKTHVLSSRAWQNPVLFGASIMSHPLEDPGIVDRFPVRRVVVQGPWNARMFAEVWGDRVRPCLFGIDTGRWAPEPGRTPDIDVLVYDKIRWERERHVPELLEPLRREIERRGLRWTSVRYGSYREEAFEALVKRSRSMVFLCEHETQGFAYQQALSSGLPILAWDRGGFWQDPEYYPERVRFSPVSSVPVWDARCGETFAGAGDLAPAFERFWERVPSGSYDPRACILENVTLERCSRQYLELWREAFGEAPAVRP